MTFMQHRGGSTIIFSFIIAIILTIIPLPHWAELLRPEWLLMVFIYWCLALPERIGVGSAWFLGLLLDVIRGTLLGQHALSMALVGFIVLKVHQRVRIFPLHQQAFTVFMLSILQVILNLWIEGMIDNDIDMWIMLLPTISTALLWPWFFLLMRFIRRRYRVV